MSPTSRSTWRRSAPGFAARGMPWGLRVPLEYSLAVGEPLCVKRCMGLDIVRRGYDALSYRYRGDSEAPEQYASWLAQLRERVPAGGAILDLGCGCGVPVARELAASATR
jgi:hypothetical protein